MISIAINVYKETEPQIKECLNKVKQNLPTAKVKLFLDGVNRPEIISLAQNFNYDAETGEGYCSHEKWPLYWIRMLKFFQNSKSPYCLKIDPDTMVDRTPKLCNYDYYGSIQHHNNVTTNPAFVQGGITGISQKAIKLVLDMDILNNVPKIDKIVSFVGPISEWPLCDDQLFAWTLRQVGIYPHQWDECYSQWRKPVENKDLKFAIIHPRYINNS